VGAAAAACPFPRARAASPARCAVTAGKQAPPQPPTLTPPNKVHKVKVDTARGKVTEIVVGGAAGGRGAGQSSKGLGGRRGQLAPWALP
jgi:hypothetical protein